MARAATKRNQGARKTARAVASDQPRARKKKEKTLEDELFFNRLRGHAKWAFVLLAVVFATSFVFLGVGSGNAGLSDVFSNIFGGGSGSSISSLQKKVAENPKSQQAVVDLALALGRDGRTEEAIGAYRTYLDEKPRDTVVLGNLAILYQQLASTAANDANAALRASALAAPAAQFRPGSGALGNALGSFVDPISQTASSQAEQAYQEALGRYRTANKDSLTVYKQLTALSPNEPSGLLRYAQAAADAGEYRVSLTAYQQFVKRFPTDSLVRDAKQRIAALKKQIAQSGNSISVPGLSQNG